MGWRKVRGVKHFKREMGKVGKLAGGFGEGAINIKSWTNINQIVFIGNNKSEHKNNLRLIITDALRHLKCKIWIL